MDHEELRHHTARALAKEAVFHVVEMIKKIHPAEIQDQKEEFWDNMEAYLTGRFKGIIAASGDMTTDMVLVNLGMEPNRDNMEQFAVMLSALKIHDERNRRYHSVWKESGWRGALFDLNKKARRLFRQFFWSEYSSAHHTDEDADDAFDLINFSCFFIRARREGNEWGNWL